MRRLLRLAVLSALACAVCLPFAQAQAPTGSQPLPGPDLPPKGLGNTHQSAAKNRAADAEVKVIRRGSETVEEHRIRGHLFMIKITPDNGAPYYLVDERGDGEMTRQDTDASLRIRQWQIGNF